MVKLTVSERKIGSNDGDIVFTVKRSRRRTVALRVEPSGAITVYAPHFVWGPFIDRFVRRQTAWILKKVAYFKAAAQRHPRHEFASDEMFPVWGTEVRLDDILPPETLACGPDTIRTALRGWYTRRLEEKLPAAVSRNSIAMGVSPRRVRVADQTSRWGSCSVHGDVRFSWRLAMLPEDLLEYVVVHELAHIQVMNHSPRFWAVVQSILPDYKQRRAWLRKNSLQFVL